MSNPNPINALTELGMRNAESTRRQPVQVDYSRLLFLVVDPAKEMRGAMTMTLSSMGANKVEFATRIGDALSRIQKNDIDIILSEYDLEHSADGLHLLEEIKQRNLCKQSTVFMIVTAERRAQNVIGAVEQAPDDYLLKPFTGEALSKRLDKAIRKKQEFRCVDDAMRNNEYLRAIEE
ncbi:MAG: response regulator, partial [Neisseriaceae bacterium]